MGYSIGVRVFSTESGEKYKLVSMFEVSSIDLIKDIAFGRYRNVDTSCKDFLDKVPDYVKFEYEDALISECVLFSSSTLARALEEMIVASKGLEGNDIDYEKILRVEIGSVTSVMANIDRLSGHNSVAMFWLY